VKRLKGEKEESRNAEANFFLISFAFFPFDLFAQAG
jgi:hypothetical protein